MEQHRKKQATQQQKTAYAQNFNISDILSASELCPFYSAQDKRQIRTLESTMNSLDNALHRFMARNHIYIILCCLLIFFLSFSCSCFFFVYIFIWTIEVIVLLVVGEFEVWPACHWQQNRIDCTKKLVTKNDETSLFHENNENNRWTSNVLNWNTIIVVDFENVHNLDQRLHCITHSSD